MSTCFLFSTFRYVCDAQFDCGQTSENDPDLSDEAGCGEPESCPPNTFPCKVRIK